MQHRSDRSFKGSHKKGCLIVLLIFLVVLVCASLLVYGFITLSLNQINRPDPNETFLSEQEWDNLMASENAGGETYAELDPVEVDFEPGSLIPIGGTEDMVNILLIGQDRRPGERRARSDAMILCSFRKSTGEITMVSFLRDLYVQIPDYNGDSYRDNRLNAAYAFGGMELLDAALKENFGVIVDANIEVDFDGFISVIDILGGVDISLTQEEADYMNRGKKWGLTAGTNHLDGKQALAYSQIRYIGTDFGRTNRQRNVLNSLFQEMKSKSLPEIISLVNEIFPLLTTDMTNSEIISYVTELLPTVSKGSMETLYIPYEGTYNYATIRGMSVLLPNYTENRKLLQDALLGEP